MTRKINCNWETETSVDRRDIWLRNEVLRKQKAAEAQVQMNKKIDAEFIANVPARVRDTVIQRIKVAKENKEANVRDRELRAAKLHSALGFGQGRGVQQNEARTLELEKVKAYAEKNKVAVITAKQDRNYDWEWDW